MYRILNLNDDKCIFYSVDCYGYMSGPYTYAEYRRSCNRYSAANWVRYPDTPEGRAEGDADQAAAANSQSQRY